MWANSSGGNAGEMQLPTEMWKRECLKLTVKRSEGKGAQSNSEVSSLVGGVYIAGDQKQQRGLEKNLQVVEKRAS